MKVVHRRSGKSIGGFRCIGCFIDQRLQRAGMIRKIDETNLRQNMLYLTEEGEKQQKKPAK